MITNKGAGLYFHPVSDPVIDGMGKNIVSINHAPLQEEAVMYLILDLFGDKEAMPKAVVDYLAGFHSAKTVTVEETIKEKVVETVTKTVKNEETGEEEEVTEEVSKMVPKKVSKEVEVDDNRLFEIVGVPAKFEESLEKLLKKKDAFSMIVGPDLYTHPNSRNLARLVALIEKYTAFDLVMIPALTNTLGVGLICELDAEAGEYSIGYNTAGDFVLSGLGDGDLDMPAINQQEGTLTSINKRVNPTNVAIGYGGYVLNDLANALGLEAEYTIDYTEQLPVSAGFKAEKFDDLPNHYTNDGVEHRGYLLGVNSVEVSGDESVEGFDEAAKMEGTLVYLVNPVRQFTPFTNKAHQLQADGGLYLSEDALEKGELNEGDSVVVKTEFGEVTTKVICDNKIAGEIACLPTFDSKLNSEALFGGYRFATASIEKV